MVPGLGPTRCRKLVNALGSPAELLKASAAEMSRVRGIGRELAERIAGFQDKNAVDSQFAAADRSGSRMVTLFDDEYPVLLREIYDPPLHFWVRGEMLPEDEFAVAVVGTRKATPYGRSMAERFAAGLTELGYTIVSGLAYGVDTAAHRGALKAGGRSIGVLGSGVDRIYPSSNREIAERMVENGCVVSEYPMGTAPEGPNFPRRNRVISGMSLGVIIVEAFEEGGALITARLAIEQNREVFAVPSPLVRPNSPGYGCNRLIQRGHAKLVMSVDDVIDEIPQPIRPGGVSKDDDRVDDPSIHLDTPEERRLYEVLGGSPIHLDALCAETSTDPSTALVHLLNLEFKGLVRQLGGKQFVRNQTRL